MQIDQWKLDCMSGVATICDKQVYLLLHFTGMHNRIYRRTHGGLNHGMTKKYLNIINYRKKLKIKSIQKQIDSSYTTTMISKQIVKYIKQRCQGQKLSTLPNEMLDLCLSLIDEFEFYHCGQHIK